MKKALLFLIFFVAFCGSAWAEPIVIIVNQNNAVGKLSLAEAQRYFLLRSKSWPSGEKVKPINRDRKSKVKDDFIKSVLKMSPRDYSKYWLNVKQTTGETEPRSVKSNKFVLKIVGRKSAAIGYLPEKYYENLGEASKAKVKVVLRAN